MSYLLGMNAKLYRLSTGTRATWGAAGSDGYTHEATAAPSSLDEVTNVQDLGMPSSNSEANVSIRGSSYKLTVGTQTDASVSFKMVYDPTDADMLAFMKAHALKATIACAVLDGAKTVVGTLGFWADFHCTKFDKSENLEEAQMVDVEIKPTYSAVAPERVSIIAA